MQDVNVSKWCMCVRTKNNVNIYSCLNGLPKDSQRKNFHPNLQVKLHGLFFLHTQVYIIAVLIHYLRGTLNLVLLSI